MSVLLQGPWASATSWELNIVFPTFPPMSRVPVCSGGWSTSWVLPQENHWPRSSIQRSVRRPGPSTKERLRATWTCPWEFRLHHLLFSGNFPCPLPVACEEPLGTTHANSRQIKDVQRFVSQLNREKDSSLTFLAASQFKNLKKRKENVICFFPH